MNIDHNNDSAQNDKALSKLYKSGVKNKPPLELDRKILDYAANKNKPGFNDSHFGGGWKVPLSLAASVLLVFTILLQLDKNPDQLPKELPPLPTSEKADIFSTPADSDLTNDKNRSLNETSDSQPNPNDYNDVVGFDAEEALNDRAAPTDSKSKAEARKKLQRQNQGVISQPESTLEQSAPNNDYRTRSEAEQKREITPQNTPKSMQDISKEPAINSTNKAKQSSIQEYENAAGENVATESIESEDAMLLESNQMQKSVPARKDGSLIGDETETKTGDTTEFATLPAKDWLQSIKELIKNEDYAEASLQLEKFKQAHPEINVSNLETKIP